MPRSPANAPPKPLSAPVFHILLVLADGPRHGYAIKQEVESRSEGSIRVGPGTLYEAIQRRYYRLTDRGWRVLRAEVRRLGSLVARARANPRLKKELA
jgi:DNA-binding PadR family transcriptional regulator